MDIRRFHLRRSCLLLPFRICACRNLPHQNASGKYADALQVLELEKGAMEDISGRFCEGAIYDIDEKEAEAFDAQFPPKEKGYLPSQDRFMEMVQSVHSL
jgi:hypothetical protein